MSPNIIKWLFIALLSLPLGKGWVVAQDTTDTSIEQKLENLAENSQNEEEDYTELFRTLEFYRLHPINLNNTSTAQLLELGMLDDIQIENLLAHIDKHGKLISIYELQSIDGFALPVIEKIIPFVTVTDVTEEPQTGLKQILKNGTHEFILRGQQVLEEQAGYTPMDSAGSPNSRYLGDRQKMYARYRFTYGNNVSAGFTAEKDAGEKNYFDFYSAHLIVRNLKFIKALAIGDYQIGFGQGVTSWSGLAYGKSYDAVNIKRSAAGIRPYVSADENRFMRGIALTAGGKSLQATGFVSRKKVDANLSDSSYTLQTTGMHSTPSEVEAKDAITQTVMGGNLSFRKRKYSFGLTGMHTIFDRAITNSQQIYNQFSFTGTQLTNLGADYSVLIKNFNFFGEMTVNYNPDPKGGKAALAPFRAGGYGVLNGCIVSLDPKVSFSLLHRSYSRNYQSLNGNAFAESTSANEQGFYAGINAKPNNKISINAYYDHFKFPWLKYQVSAPSSGSEYVLQVNYTTSKKLDTYVRVRQKDKFVNSTATDELDFLSPYRQINYRWHVGYRVSPSIRLANRIELISITTEQGQGAGGEGQVAQENGFLVYQDVMYKKPGRKFSCTFRYALFDTKNYDTRIYAYEYDVPGSFSIPSYYNKGSRVYAMLCYNPTRHLEFWLRCSQTYYSNQHVISEGTLNEIQGNSKTEVKVELQVKF